MLFNMNASSGGLDIVAKIMNKYLHMDLRKGYVPLRHAWRSPPHWFTTKDGRAQCPRYM